MPRFYRKRLLLDPKFAALDEERRQEYLDDLDPVENSPDRLEVREAVHKARVGFYRRERSF